MLPFIFVISFPCWTLNAAETLGHCSDLLLSPVKKWDGTSDMLAYMDDLLENRKIKNPKLDLEYVYEEIKLGEVRNPIRKENRELSPRDLYHHDQLQRYIQNPELLNQKAIQTWVEKKLQIRKKIQRQRVVAKKKTESLLSSKNICERTKAVRLAIMKALKKSNCSEITDEDLESITVLNLSKKKITRLEEGDFSGLSALKNLHLYDNQTSELPERIFRGLSSLEVLYFFTNKINKLPGKTFRGLSSLKVLDLDSNQISKLPGTIFSGLSELKTLHLYNNNISKLSKKVFSGLTSLQGLYLSDNQISELPETVFTELSLLEELILSNNKVSELPQITLPHLSSMKWFDLGNNKIGTLSTLKIHQLCRRKKIVCSI